MFVGITPTWGSASKSLEPFKLGIQNEKNKVNQRKKRIALTTKSSWCFISINKFSLKSFSYFCPSWKL